MQKFLVIALGVLGIVLLAELLVLVWQKNTSSSHVSVFSPPSPSFSLLPLSSTANSVITPVVADPNKPNEIYWKNKLYIYQALRNNTTSRSPIGAVGKIAEIKNDFIILTGLDSNQNIGISVNPNTKIKQLDNKGKTKSWNPILFSQLKKDDKAQVIFIEDSVVNNGTMPAKYIYVF